MAKLTEDDVKMIRKLYIPKEMGCLRLAQRFNVSKSLIGAIINGKAWTHVA